MMFLKIMGHSGLSMRSTQKILSPATGMASVDSVTTKFPLPQIKCQSLAWQVLQVKVDSWTPPGAFTLAVAQINMIAWYWWPSFWDLMHTCWEDHCRWKPTLTGTDWLYLMEWKLYAIFDKSYTGQAKIYSVPATINILLTQWKIYK